MKTDHEILNERNRDHLRASLVAGEYFTEQDSMFFKHYKPGDDTLGGELCLVDKGTPCRIVRTVKKTLAASGVEVFALLVRYTDRKQKHWFAWIHA